jgi:phytoene dehydrogenase-like protein
LAYYRSLLVSTKVRLSGRSPRDARFCGRVGDELAQGDYTFETCLHWLLGSNPNGEMYSRWLEVFDIDKLTFIYPDEFVRLETEHGECLRIYSNVDRLEAELLKRGPEDAGEVRHLASAIRSLSKFRMPDLTEGWAGNWLPPSTTFLTCRCCESYPA